MGIDLDLGCHYELKKKGGGVAGRCDSNDKISGTEDTIVKMDAYNSSQIMCGLALFQNVNNETFSVEKIVQFYQGHRALD